ncbi:MAG: AMP-binding protein [Marinibacterium profundimaris]
MLYCHGISGCVRAGVEAAERGNLGVFWHLAHDSPDRTALMLEGGAGLTYRELEALACGWCDRIRAAGGGGGAIAALEIDITPEAIAAYLGCLRAGCPVLLAEPGTLTEQSAILRTWQPEIHIRRSGDGTLEIAPPTAPAGEAPPPHPDLALLLSTSGSTGDPKLVRLSAGNIASNAAAIAAYLDIRPGDVAATTLPLFYSYGLSVLNSYLQAGATLWLTSRSVTEPEFWEGARAAGVTSLALVPHQCETIATRDRAMPDLPGLRYVTQAGGKLAPHRVRALAAQGRRQGWGFYIMYGQTEAAPRMSYVPPEALPAAADTIGRPIPGGRIWLSDEAGAPVDGTGVAGELVYEGPNVMLGYAGTRADLAKGREIDVLRTGDIAERTEDGFFRIVGRSKRFVKLFGLRLNLDQVEALLEQAGHPAMAEAVEDRLVVLYVMPQEGDDPGPEIAGLLADACHLPPSEVLTAPLDRIPYLPNGKTDRRALQDKARAALEQAQRTDQGEGQGIREIIREATRSRRVSPDDTYNALGGDSLSYLRVQMRLESLIGAVPKGWEKQPIRALEALAAGAAPPGRAARTRVGADVVLRVCAISLVVVQHATDYPLEGGTWILVLLMGMTAAQFQMKSVIHGRPWRILGKMLFPIVPLYYAVIISFELLRRPISISYFTLTRNYDPLTETTIMGVYWFVALYVQLVLALAVMACLPPLRRRMRAAPWRTSVVLFCGSILLSAMLFMASPVMLVEMYGETRVLSVFPALHIQEQGFFECLPIFLSGWVLAVADGRIQRAAALALCALALGVFSLVAAYSSSALFLAVALVFAWSRWEIPVPLWMGQGLRRLASVSLFVYLTHMVVVYVLLNLIGAHAWIGQPATAALALAAAFAVALLLDRWFVQAEHLARQIRRA